MKKIFISLFLSGVFMYHTNAQTAVEGNKFSSIPVIGRMFPKKE